MPFYATETLIAQKRGHRIIVQNQAPKMNAEPITIFVKRVPHVFARVRISLFFSNAQNFSLQLLKNLNQVEYESARGVET